MISVAAIVLCFSLFIPDSHCFLKGDIDGDDKIGLKEGINALQVTAGMRSATVNTTINVPGDFVTIQEAIDAASKGDIINVAAGTYNETLTIIKDGITLRGADRSSTIISGNTEDSTILLRNSRNIEIQNCSIRNGYYGINLYYSSLKCTYIAIENNNHGLRARYNSYISVENTFIKNNTGAGVRLNNGSTGYFDNCEITNNSGTGLTSDRAASVFINNSKISNNGATGIQAWLGGNMSGGDNEIKSNGGPGIDISGNSSGSLYGNNSITDNGKNFDWAGGVTIHHGSYCIINNTDDISQNQGPGIRVYNNGMADINGTKINNNNGNGVDIEADSTAQLIGAIITLNSGYGVNCSGGKLFEHEQEPIDFGSQEAGTLNTLGDKNSCD